MNPPSRVSRRAVLRSALGRGALARGAWVLLPLALVAWALHASIEQRRLSMEADLDRQASEYALVVQGRLEAVLGSARFAAARLQVESVREAAFCQLFMADLLQSQAAVVGGAVVVGSDPPQCQFGQAPEAAVEPMQPDTWRLQPPAQGSLRLDVHRAARPSRDEVLVSLRLDEAALVAGLERDVELLWGPGQGPAGPAAASPARALHVDAHVVGRVRARPAAGDDRAALSLPAVAALLLAGVVLTALALRALNRTRQRGDSQRLMRIARHPQEEELLHARMRDDDLAAAARVVADEQRQLRALSHQLQYAKERLEEVQRVARIGSWRSDLATGSIEWSDQAHEILGVPRSEALGAERMYALVHPEDRSLLIDRQRALMAGEADLDLVHRIERPGGEERVVHSRGTVAARDASGRPTALLGTVQDVTEAWEVSALSDALARALAQSADAVLMTREHAGIWLWAWSNRAWERLCEQLQIDGREAHHQLFNPAVGLLRAHVDRVREASAERKVLRVDLQVASAQGARWFEAELIPQVSAPGRAGHGLLLLRDRTLERQAAQALRQANARLEQVVGERTAALARSEQQYRVLADLSPQILWQADPQGRVSYLNRAWDELVGPREGGWLGLRWLDSLHPDDRAKARAAFSDGLRDGQPWSARRRVKDRKGEYRSLLGVAAPFVRDDGTLEGWIGVEADITELEHHATQLQQLNAELETFSYTVSHDLRAPVHVVKGFVEALLSGQVGQIDSQARGYLERVLRSARRMDELIADLLGLARLSRETLQPSQFDAGELARGLLDAVRERYPDRVIELHTVGGGPLILEADRRLFQVLLENLLDNAAKFTAGRAVCRIELSWRVEHEDLVLELSDNGVGFPPELAHRLFRPYQRLHAPSAFPGHGIGLATVLRIVQLHGGSIAADNRTSGGAVFCIRLPWRAHPVAPDDTGTPIREPG